MLWVELSIDSPSEFIEPLTQVFTEHGEGGVAIESPGGHNPDEGESAPPVDRATVTTYLPHDHTLERRYGRIDVAVRLIAHVGDVSELRVRVVKDEEWQNSWKEHFHPLRVGERTVIVPTWRTHQPREGDVVIHLDPGMAFGTGHHPTTRMCLELLERHARRGDRVLDVGCGSGILSIAAAKLGAASALGLEIDPIAAEVADANIRINGVECVVRAERATLPHPDVAPKGCDLVVANVSAKVIVELAEHMVGAARSGGKLILSGILDKHRAEVLERMMELGARYEEEEADADWLALVLSAP